MYPNFCFSKSNNENLIRMKTQQCLRESKLCNCSQTSVTKPAKKLKSVRPHLSILRDKCNTKRSNKTTIRTNSPAGNAKPCVTFQLKDQPAKCDCGRNCNETTTKCELESGRERERERNRAREREREYELEQRYEQEHEFDRGRESNRRRLRTRSRKRDSSRECEPNRKSNMNFVHENNFEQEDCKKEEAMQNDDDFNLNKQLQESCADFLNIIHDNVLETVQSTVEKMLVKYYDQTMMKIDNLTVKVESNATLLNKAYNDLLAKIIEQNENSVNQFKFVAQMLINQQQQHINAHNYQIPNVPEYETVYEANVQHETSDECLNNESSMNSNPNYQQQEQQQQQAEQQQHPQSEQHARQQVGQQQQQQPMTYPYQNVVYHGKTMPISYLDMAYQNYLMWQNTNFCGHTHNCFTCNCHARKAFSKKSISSCARTKSDGTATATQATKSCRRLAKGYSSPNLSNIFHSKAKVRTKATTCQIPAPNCLPSLTKLPAQHGHTTHPTDWRCNSCTNAIGMRKTISMKTSPNLHATHI